MFFKKILFHSHRFGIYSCFWQSPLRVIIDILRDSKMSLEKTKHITAELKGHAPFTIFGALMGLVFMFVFRNIGQPHAETLFRIFHPGHVLLSAMVTASMFTMNREIKNFLLVLVVGYLGSVGIATLSDSVIPYAGETILGLNVPTHSQTHTQETEDIKDYHDEKYHGIYLGFIEEWYIVTPAAILGILI